MHLLTLLLVLPLLFAAIITFAPPALARPLALAGAALTFLFSLGLLGAGGGAGDVNGGFRFEENVAWIAPVGIRYHVGVDGVAVALILLTTFLQLFATLYSYAHPPAAHPRAFFALLMALEAPMIGSFCALDLVLFYVFFELCLIPAYFLIGMWGGRRRIPAATKFFVYTVVGSLLMLASIIGVSIVTGIHSFDFATLAGDFSKPDSSPEIALWLFAGFAIAFAVKAGVFPFHTWLPDTYAESPIPATILLSGVMAKLGTYGFYRFCIGLFPGAAVTAAPLLVTLAVISIIYGALIAAVQSDVKRVFAYSSISHLGFVVLGLFALTPSGMSGAILQMVNHGVTSGALFLCAGLIEMRRGSTVIKRLGGLWGQMPLFGRFFLIATLSSIALPLTNGFVGEFLILIGSFQTFPLATALATTGVIWSAVYMLQMFQRVMYGPADDALIRRLRDIGGFDTVLLGVFVVAIFALGIFPTAVTKIFENEVTNTLNTVNKMPGAPGAVTVTGRGGLMR